MRGSRNPLLSQPPSTRKQIPIEHTRYEGFSKAFSPNTGLNVSSHRYPCRNTMALFPTFAWNKASGFGLDLTVQSLWHDDGRLWSVRGTRPAYG